MSHLRIHYPDGTPNCKWSICVNCDAFFRISFCTIIFHVKIFRKFYYCIEVTFITFERLIFKFQRGFVAQRAKLVSWKLWCESTIKLANSITVSFGFVGLMQHFSFFFFLFDLTDRLPFFLSHWWHQDFPLFWLVCTAWKSLRIRSFSGISLYSVQMLEIMDQKSSEYGHFSRSF